MVMGLQHAHACYSIGEARILDVTALLCYLILFFSPSINLNFGIFSLNVYRIIYASLCGSTGYPF